METVGGNVIETAALGRPFQLGMLYDCRKDALIPGITLWDPEKLQQSLRVRPQINTDFKVTASDSIQDKSNLLNIDGSLKLSVLGGLVSVNGAAKYLKDTKKSFRQQRLTLHYHSTCRVEELTMNHLAPANIVHHEVFENDTATHVVTAVLYGADACFVFDREVSSDEETKTAEGEAKVALEKLKGISVDANISLKMDDTQKNAVQKFTCKFYGDFQLPFNPTSFEDALKVFTDLPKLLGEKKDLAVPLRVWLYPLDKLHSGASKLQKDISMDLIIETESVIESLKTTEMRCSDLLEDSPASAFAEFQDKILQMKQNCYKYKLRLVKKLGSLLPNIRGDVMKETVLNDLLHDHNKSPFRGRDLDEWLKERERESDVMKSVLRQLKSAGAQVAANIDLVLIDLEVGNLVSYTFTSLNWSDVLLHKQTSYLSNSANGETDENSLDSEQKSWLTPEVLKSLKSNLNIFRILIDSKGRKPDKFIVSSKEMKNNPGSCILLYESECDEAVCFIPPSKPACPIIEEVKDNSVVLKVPPSCSSTVELRLQYKQKQVTVWTSKPVMKDENKVTLTDLRAETEYEIRCAALGKLDYTEYSDVISLIIGHCVLENEGSTSCLNSVLQTLFMTKEFREHVKSDSSGDNFIKELKKLFIELEKQQKTAVSAAEVRKSLGIINVHKIADAAEHLHSIIKKTPGSSEFSSGSVSPEKDQFIKFVSVFFKCTMKTTRTCRTCRDKQEACHDFLSLIVSFEASQDVGTAVKAHIDAKWGEYRLTCLNCKTNTVCERETEMINFPKILIIQLRRLEMSSSGFKKSDRKVNISPHIKVSFYKYDLYAIIHHAGIYHSGLYFVDINCENKILRRFSNGFVSEIDINSVFRNESLDAYLLVYRRKE